MTLTEMRGATRDELLQQEKDLRKELFNLRFQKSISGSLDNPMRIRNVKREIARVKTVVNESKAEG
ncbi:MAG: 50S ribosomal protein L29 [Nitrospirae bacterium]|nr:50S ribosomal protein L29 [Nitrospirota bacterium]